MIDLDNSPMVHLVVDGKTTSRFDREMAMAPGQGVIVSKEVKGSRALSALRRVGRLVRTAHALCRHSPTISGGRGKEA